MTICRLAVMLTPWVTSPEYVTALQHLPVCYIQKAFEICLRNITLMSGLFIALPKTLHVSVIHLRWSELTDRPSDTTKSKPQIRWVIAGTAQSDPSEDTAWVFLHRQCISHGWPSPLFTTCTCKWYRSVNSNILRNELIETLYSWVLENGDKDCLKEHELICPDIYNSFWKRCELLQVASRWKITPFRPQERSLKRLPQRQKKRGTLCAKKSCNLCLGRVL